MSTFINREPVSAEIVRLDPTDFSAVTARPEFVLKGKKFHDVTGQLREGTLTSCGSVHVRFSENADGTDFSETWSDGKNYIGFAVAQVAPSAKECYTWEHVEAYLAIELQEKSVEITENGATEVLPDEGFALSKVTVNANVASGGGGEQPTLFAPLVTIADTDTLKQAVFTIANDEQNGGFAVSLALKVNGEIVENPYTATEVGAYTVEAIASAENFADGVNTQIVEVAEMPTYSEGLKYHTVGYGSKDVWSVSIGTCTDVNVRVAPISDGKPVVGVYSLSNATIETVSLPDSITILMSNSFANASNLLRIDYLPDGITSIPMSCFANCINLEYVELPKNLKTIGKEAFYNCKKLEYVKIPKGVTSIGESAFRQCAALKCVDFSEHESVPSLGNIYAISKDTLVVLIDEIRVPSALYDEWVTATNWTTYADIIVAV